jgi:ubiquinone/menaquinone biosynthesis C-methylase UbiE
MIMEGFINVDKYNPKADIQADVLNLPFEDNCAERVILCHVIEHVSYKKTIDLLEEIHRVMVVGGSFELAYPEFEKCIEAFINNEKGERWRWWIQTLYGSQENAGQYHVAPIVTSHLIEQLREVGFDSFDYELNEYNAVLKCKKCEPLPWH